MEVIKHRGKERKMIDATNRRRKFTERIRKSHPVKLTALLYLRQALLKEDYEICSDLIAIAKEFGASDTQIRNLLEDPRRTPT